jgi:predicted transcriptional regulator of viral defense system
VNASRAAALLRGLDVPAFSTADAAARLQVSPLAATHILRRLGEAGMARRVRKGLWTLREPVEPLALVDVVTAPYPAYVSLQTALHLHGMIEQIPSVVYTCSLSRTRRIRTEFGTFSVHRVAPEFFGGFEIAPRSGAKIATPEKALLDVLYLSGGRSRLFASLPELELPRGFRLGYARRWITRIPSARLRTLVTRGFEALTRTKELPRGPRRGIPGSREGAQRRSRRRPVR